MEVESGIASNSDLETAKEIRQIGGFNKYQRQKNKELSLKSNTEDINNHALKIDIKKADSILNEEKNLGEA